ncbi:hypothetical protein WME91_34530 [Sorangium sp. So ce269]
MSGALAVQRRASASASSHRPARWCAVKRSRRQSTAPGAAPMHRSSASIRPAPSPSRSAARATVCQPSAYPGSSATAWSASARCSSGSGDIHAPAKDVTVTVLLNPTGGSADADAVADALFEALGETTD